MPSVCIFPFLSDFASRQEFSHVEMLNSTQLIMYPVDQLTVQSHSSLTTDGTENKIVLIAPPVREEEEPATPTIKIASKISLLKKKNLTAEPCRHRMRSDIHKSNWIPVWHFSILLWCSRDSSALNTPVCHENRSLTWTNKQFLSYTFIHLLQLGPLHGADLRSQTGQFSSLLAGHMDSHWNNLQACVPYTWGQFRQNDPHDSLCF